MRQVFLGRLRDSEVERVNDKVGQAVVETCLAMTIFREDFTASFLM
jgi:E3 ubiquitin-protein ligase synoviolin